MQRVFLRAKKHILHIRVIKLSEYLIYKGISFSTQKVQ